MYAAIHKHTLNFNFLAGTSRGVLRTKDSYLVSLFTDNGGEFLGIGECAPLKGLSCDDLPNYEELVHYFASKLTDSNIKFNTSDQALRWVSENIGAQYPSIRFGFEIALLDMIGGGKQQLLSNNWSLSPNCPLPINGLVWMNDKDHMMEQVKEKINAGFDCIKLKIGAIDFDNEIELLMYIREYYHEDQITIRVDANGAFSENDVFEKLERLSEYDIHSIEQPVKPDQHRLMKKVCNTSPIPVALDEELIGIEGQSNKLKLLKDIRPQYIIIKPSLVGGISGSREWIDLATECHIGWWITSALESNIGLNAISQLTATYDINMPQGLGTGQLYSNNIQSPLVIENGKLYYDDTLSWNYDLIKR